MPYRLLIIIAPRHTLMTQGHWEIQSKYIAFLQEIDGLVESFILNMATSKEIKEEYTSSLADLTFNSKPLISVLTMLAEENSQHARDIVEAIETHLSKVIF